MKISKLFTEKPRVLSFELFPPKRDGNLEGLFATVEELKRLSPDYVSVTYGAGGSTRDMTYDIALRLKNTGILPLVHFTCVGHSRSEVKELLDRLKGMGIENILALRGDPPQGQAAYIPPPDGFSYANELVGFIRSEGYDFCVGVAGYPETHPEARSPEEDLQNLKRKTEAGGEFIVTQLFFDNADYFKFVENIRAKGVTLPVQPGIWLLTDFAQIQKVCSLSGAKFPADLREKLEKVKDDKDQVAQIGIDYATRQCEGLLREKVPGIHFYVMNKSRSVRAVVENLRKHGWFLGDGQGPT